MAARLRGTIGHSRESMSKEEHVGKKNRRDAAAEARRRALRERREAQARRDRRNRLIIWVSVVVVLALVVGLVVWAIAKSRSQASETSSASTLTLNEATANSAGFVIGSNGPGQATEGAPTVDFYFDYTCPGCISLEHEIGDELFDDAAKGTYTLVLHPVSTHETVYRSKALALAVRVYQDQPELFVDLHKALEAYVYEHASDDDAMNANGLDSVLSVASDVGVNQTILDQLGSDDVTDILQEWTQAWSARVKDLGGAQVATPMFIRDNTLVTTDTIEGYDSFDDYLPALRGQ